VQDDLLELHVSAFAAHRYLFDVLLQPPPLALDHHALIDSFERLLAEDESLVSSAVAAHSADQDDGRDRARSYESPWRDLPPGSLADPREPRIGFRLPLAPRQAAVRREN
jgi:hypothetical protein